MVTVPAFVWRGGSVRRAIIIGATVGLCLGGLAWLDSGVAAVGAIVAVAVGTFYGLWMSRRMTRHWPGSVNLSGAERVSVVRAARHGQPIGDPRLARPVADYRDALHAAVETARPWRWVLPLVLVVAVGTAIWDGIFGSWGNAVASAIYLIALGVELLWWPRRQAGLLANAAQAVSLAGADDRL
jgi:hypothetical protein